MPPGSVPLSPIMKDKHLADTSWLQGGSGDSHLDASMLQLTHLEILSSTLDTSGQKWAPPVVLAIRSHVPAPNSHYQALQTTIDRWEVLNDQQQGIHPAFEQLGSRRNSTASQPTVRIPAAPQLCSRLSATSP